MIGLRTRPIPRNRRNLPPQFHVGIQDEKPHTGGIVLATRAELTLGQVLFFYSWGLVAGAQLALYMYDYFDDGMAEALSGLIGVGLVLLGTLIILARFRRRAAS